MRAIATIAIALGLLAGCATRTTTYPSASPGYAYPYPSRYSCETAGGTWYAVSGTCVFRR